MKERRFPGIFLYIVSLTLFWGVLAITVSPSFSMALHSYSLSSFLLVLILYFLALQLPDDFRWPVSLGLTMILFALTLSYVWTSGFSDNFIIGGLLPYKDARNYLLGTDLIRNGLPLVNANQATERPLFPGFLASILFFTGQNLKLTVALLTQFMAVGLWSATRPIRNSFGPLAGSLFAAFLYYYIQPWIGYTMSEVFGFMIGCFGFSLLWLAAARNNWLDLFLGLGALLVGVSARAGAFFIFPLLAVWVGWLRRNDKAFSLKIGSAVLGLTLVGYLLINSLYARFLGIPPGSSFGNFSYMLYGQVKGGTGWHSAIAELGTRNPALVYRAAWQFFLQHPLSLFIGFAKSYLGFFQFGGNGILPFIGQPWLNFILWLAAWVLVVLGIVKLLKDVQANTSSFLLAGLIGVFLSIPFLPPVDGGVRFHASTVSFFFAVPAVGISSLVKAKSSSSNSDIALWRELLFLRCATVIITMLTVLMAVGIFLLNHKPAYTTPACSATQKPFVVQINSGSYIDLIKASVGPCGKLPNVCVTDFETNNTEKSTDDFYQKLFSLLANEKSKVRLVAGFDLLTERPGYFYFSRDKLPSQPLNTLVSGCAVKISTKNQIIMQVETLAP